jgi:hypothetical protein
MEFIIAAAGVAYAATVVWLAVRRINRREWWTASVILGFVVFPVLYVLSYAAFWPLIADGSQRTGGPSDYLRMGAACFYIPLMMLLDSGPVVIRDAVRGLMAMLH